MPSVLQHNHQGNMAFVCSLENTAGNPSVERGFVGMLPTASMSSLILEFIS